MGDPQQRAELVGLVRALAEVDHHTEAEGDELLRRITELSGNPHAQDLLFWDPRDRDRAPTPDELVDRLLAHRPIAL